MQISLDKRVYAYCNSDRPERCEVADLVGKHGPLKVSGSIVTADKTRYVFSDRNLPLSGPHTILGHSIVIHDKLAPKHRGNRMGCAG